MIFKLMNKSHRTLQLLMLWCRSNLKCVVAEIIKINHKTIKHVIVYKIYVTVEVIKRKLIIVILKEWKGLYAKFLNALKSIGGSAVMLIISREFLIIKFC